MVAMTAAGLGLAATKLLAGGLTPPAPVSATNGDTTVPTDAATQFNGIPGNNVNQQVLNYALTLEFLEADLYRQALNFASGRALGAPLSANSGDYSLAIATTGLKPIDASELFNYLVQFTYVEAAHRDFLIAALAQMSAPTVSANPNGYKFTSALPSNLAKLMASAILPLEETGVRAYLGALPYLTDLSLAQTAGTIFSTEARHSAVIGANVGIDTGPRVMNGDLRVNPAQPAQNTFEYYLKPLTVRSKASAYFA